MKESLIITLLSLLSIGSLAAVFILWAKLDEQKKLTQEEREKRWQETSIALTVEKEKDAEIDELQEWLRSFEKRGDFWYETAEKTTKERDELQDKLSSILCPRNDHVWKDGICTKCGKPYGTDQTL